MSIDLDPSPLARDAGPTGLEEGKSGAPCLCDKCTHRNTINNIEVGHYTGDTKTLELIEKTLSVAGVGFIHENGCGPGVRLRKRQKRKG